MEKYTLEAFERYPMVRCRPEETRDVEPDRFVFRTVSAPEAEKQGRFLLEVRRESLQQMAALCSLPQAVGFTIVPGASDDAFLETAVRAMGEKRYIVPVSDCAQIRWAGEKGVLGGLLVEIRDNPLDACEQMAVQELQKMYRKVPVFVRNCGTGHSEAYARQWHASMVENMPGTCAGWRIALRRITYPRAVTSGGFAPMRFWWTNRGPAFVHEQTSVRLRLRMGQETIGLPLADSPDHIGLGDRVYNEIVRMPDLPPGTYAMEYGLFGENGDSLMLCHAGRSGDGYYPAGMLCVDDIPRPEYEHIWDDYYADGYYPLVDPPVPGT